MRKSTGTKTRKKRGRPIDLGKRQAIIRAAQCVFIEQGFEATSLDAVALEAGVSKLTIYNHFGGKDELFAAALIDKCDHFMRPETLRTAGFASTRDGLIHIGRSFLDLLLDAEALKMHRVVMAESAKHPKVATLFFEQAVRRTSQKVGEFVAGEARAGRLVVRNVESATSAFLSLVKGFPMMLALFNQPLPSRSELNSHVETATDIFLAAFAPKRR